MAIIMRRTIRKRDYCLLLGGESYLFSEKLRIQFLNWYALKILFYLMDIVSITSTKIKN